MKIKTLLLLSASALLLASCSGGENPEASQTPASEAESSLPEQSASEEPEVSSEAPVSSEVASSELEDSSEESSVPAPVEKPNLFYQDGDIRGGTGETDMKPGQLAWWAGDGGSVSSLDKEEGGYALHYAAAGAWYGVQVFYKLPYSNAGDNYHIELTFHSDVAGSITLNSQVITLEANQDFAYSADYSCSSSTVLSLQLGVNGGGLMGGSVLRFSTPVITDLSSTEYHPVSFQVGESKVKEILVKDGKSVTAPKDPEVPEGKVFAGWYAGEEKFSPDAVITSAKEYVATFADASSSKTVTFKTSDGKVLKQVQVALGETLTKPTDVSIFAYEIVSWAKESGEAYDFSAPVNEDLTLIAKTQIAPSTWFNAEDTGWVIPSINTRLNEDGSFEVYDLAPFASGSSAYFAQVNFAPVPAVAGKSYELSFQYKINGQGGDAQIYDNGTIGNLVSLTASSEYQTATISFSQALSEGSKLTFELGAVSGVEKINFFVRNVSLIEK